MKRLLTTGLATHIDQFCRDAAASGALLVLPRTVVMEDERHQQRLYDETVAALEDASSLLGNWGVAVPRHGARELVGRADLPTVLRATGIMVEIEEPTLADYRDAERRASFHLAPQAPDAKSDEMRDLIIWAVALRIAERDGGAMIVSRDEVHVDERGLKEAEAVSLLRAKTFAEALDLLGGISPAGALARSLLSTVWDELKSAGLPLPAEIPSRPFSDLQFVADEAGHATGSLTLAVPTTDGLLVGNAHIFQATPSTIRIDLSGLRIGSEQWKTGSLSVTANRELPRIARSLGERLHELRSIIEDKQ